MRLSFRIILSCRASFWTAPVVVMACAAPATAQFGGFVAHELSASASHASSAYATDLDGDGDADVLSASILDNKIAWYENQGGGQFGPQQVITTAADFAYSVYAAGLGWL